MSRSIPSKGRKHVSILVPTLIEGGHSDGGGNLPLQNRGKVLYRTMIGTRILVPLPEWNGTRRQGDGSPMILATVALPSSRTYNNLLQSYPSMFKPVFTKEELALIRRLNKPEKVQEFLLKEIEYDNQDELKEEEETWRSFRRVIRDKNAHCLEGALTAAAIMSQHNYPPVIICMEARDIDHIVFAYKRKGRWGSVAKSRDENLLSREPRYRTLKDLVMSYYPFFYNLFSNDLTDITMRGYAKVDLRIFEKDWITTEEDLTFIVDHLYRIPYRKLFPRSREDRFYFSPREDGMIS